MLAANCQWGLSVRNDLGKWNSVSPPPPLASINYKHHQSKAGRRQSHKFWCILSVEPHFSWSAYWCSLACGCFSHKPSMKGSSRSPLYGGMLITRLARLFGVLQKREAIMITMDNGKPFSSLIYKRVNTVVDNGVGNFSIPSDNPRDWAGRRVRQRLDDLEEEPPVIPIEDEMPMDPYNVALCHYQDNLGRGVNYANMNFNFMMQHMNILLD